MELQASIFMILRCIINLRLQDEFKALKRQRGTVTKAVAAESVSSEEPAQSPVTPTASEDDNLSSFLPELDPSTELPKEEINGASQAKSAVSLTRGNSIKTNHSVRLDIVRDRTTVPDAIAEDLTDCEFFSGTVPIQ